MSEHGKPESEELVLSLLAEEATVAVRKVDRGGVRVHVQTSTREQLIDEEVARERVEITRVPVDRVVSVIPVDRVEGDTTILSIVEEVLVVERRLVLKEEIHMRRIRTTGSHQETVVLRRQEASIERTAPDRADAGVNPGAPATAFVSAEPPSEAAQPSKSPTN